MAKHTELRLTERETAELWALLFSVLTNGDQWDHYDLNALRRVADKLKVDR